MANKKQKRQMTKETGNKDAEFVMTNLKNL